MIQESLFSESLRLLQPSDPSLTAQSLKLTSLDQFLSGLSPGQIITGNIVEKLPSGKAVVQFNEHRVAVDIGRGGAGAKSFQARVEQLSPTPLLKLVSTIPSTEGENGAPGSVAASVTPGKADVVQISRHPQLHKQISGTLSQEKLALLGLKAGDRVTADVISSQPDGTARALVNGKETILISAGGRNLTPGSKVVVEVRQQAKGFALLVPREGEQKSPGNLLKNLLPQRQSLSGLIKNLEQQVQDFIKQGGTLPEGAKNRLDESFQIFKKGSSEPRSAEEIKTTVERSGLGYEAKVKSLFEHGGKPELKSELLRDFKGQLQELSRFLESRAGTISKVAPDAQQALGKQVNATLQNIEILQINHFLARQENLPLALFLPNTLENNSGQFKIFYREENGGEENKKSESKKDYNLVFLLDMSRLGKIRVDATIRGSSIDLQVYVESEPVLKFLEQGFEPFQEQLMELGFEGKIQGQINSDRISEEGQEIDYNLLESMDKLVDILT